MEYEFYDDEVWLAFVASLTPIPSSDVAVLEGGRWKEEENIS